MWSTSNSPLALTCDTMGLSLVWTGGYLRLPDLDKCSDRHALQHSLPSLFTVASNPSSTGDRIHYLHHNDMRLLSKDSLNFLRRRRP